MKKMNKKIWEAIKEYQFPGCVSEYPTKTNVVQDGVGIEWSEHVAGTLVMPYVGTIFLGMPKGFNRLGIFDGHNKEQMNINIFENWEQFNELFIHSYGKYNVPVWKYVNEKGHTFVRGLMPRLNRPFLHIILENCIDKIECYQVTDEDLEEMN
jgi:hypothetical protein